MLITSLLNGEARPTCPNTIDEKSMEMLKCSVYHLANALHLALALLASNSLASKFAPIPSLYIQVYHFVFKRQYRKNILGICWIQ